MERTYREFKSRVAEGRGKDTAYIETIAQGHVWTGTQGIQIGLVDEIGGLDEAIAYAAKKANVKDYRVKLYPEEKTLGEQLREAFGDAKSDAIKGLVHLELPTGSRLKAAMSATPRPEKVPNSPIRTPSRSWRVRLLFPVVLDRSQRCGTVHPVTKLK